MAEATFIAEWSAFGLGLWLCRGAFATPAWRDRVRVFYLVILRRMMAVHRDILLRSVLLQAMFISFLFYGADFGDVTLAANQILIQFLHITGYTLDGFAFAAEALVGQAMGARATARLRRAAVLASFWGGVCVVVLSVVFALTGPLVIDVMATSLEVRAEARIYLIYMVLAPLIGCAAWMLDGIFIGATRAADMRNMMAVSFAVYCAAVALLVPVWENHGLWMALLVSFVARGVTLGLRYPALERQAGLPH